MYGCHGSLLVSDEADLVSILDNVLADQLSSLFLLSRPREGNEIQQDDTILTIPQLQN